MVSSAGSNMIGLYHLAIATAAAEVGQPIDVIREAFAVCARVGFAFFDEDAELVWVPNVAGIEIGDGLAVGDKRRKSVEKDLRALGSHGFVDEFVAKYGKSFRLDWKNEAPSSAPIPPTEAPSVSNLPGSEGGSHQGLTGTQQVRDPAEPLPASTFAGFFGDEREWFADAVRAETQNGKFVCPAPAKCGVLLEVMRRVPDCCRGSEAAKVWLQRSVRRYVQDTQSERRFNALTPDGWAKWIGDDPDNSEEPPESRPSIMPELDESEGIPMPEDIRRGLLALGTFGDVAIRAVKP